MKDFRQLKVWQRAHQLTLDIYKTTASFPRSEAYGLTPQIRESAGFAAGCLFHSNTTANYCGLSVLSEFTQSAMLSFVDDSQMLESQPRNHRFR